MNFGKIIVDALNSLKGVAISFIVGEVVSAAKNGLNKDGLAAICRAAGVTISKALKSIPYVKNNAQKIEDAIQDIMNTAWDAFMEGLDADDEVAAATEMETGDGGQVATA